MTVAGVRKERTPGFFRVTIITDSGNFDCERMEDVLCVAREFGNGEIAFTREGSVEIRNIGEKQLEDSLKQLERYGLVWGGTGAHVRPVMNCRDYDCEHSNCNIEELAEKFQTLFCKRLAAQELPGKLEITMDGCTRGCSGAEYTDIGVQGVVIPQFDMRYCVGCVSCEMFKSCKKHAIRRDGERWALDQRLCNRCGECVGKCPYKVARESIWGYAVYIGGQKGEERKKGYRLTRTFTTEESLFSVVERIILIYREEGLMGESFSQTMSRIGFQEIERRVLA